MFEPWNINQEKKSCQPHSCSEFTSQLPFSIAVLQHFSTVSNCITIDNSMICSDIWPKYDEWYSNPVRGNLRQFWNITSGIYTKYHVQIMLLFTTTRKRFVIFTCRYFKLSWNTTAISQSNCRNFSCSSITAVQNKVSKSKLRK